MSGGLQFCKFLMRVCVLKKVMAKKGDYFTCFNAAKEEKFMTMHSLCLFCFNNITEARGSNIKEKKQYVERCPTEFRGLGGFCNMPQCSSNCSMQAFAKIMTKIRGPHGG